jgi:hypothetical protein
MLGNALGTSHDHPQMIAFDLNGALVATKE